MASFKSGDNLSGYDLKNFNDLSINKNGSLCKS